MVTEKSMVPTELVYKPEINTDEAAGKIYSVDICLYALIYVVRVKVFVIAPSLRLTVTYINKIGRGSRVIVKAKPLQST